MGRDSRTFLAELRGQLEKLPFEVMERLQHAGGLDVSDLIEGIANPVDTDVVDPLPHQPGDIERPHREDCHAAGFCSLAANETALCIDFSQLNGQGEPVALSQSNPFIKLGRVGFEHFKTKWILAAPAWVSELERMMREPFHLPGFIVIPTFETIQLTPANTLHSRELLPCGSGDVLSALHASRELQKFAAAGGKYIAYMDGIRGDGLTLPETIGFHASHNLPVTFDTKFADGSPAVCRHPSFPGGVGLAREQFCYPRQAFKALEMAWTGNAVLDVDPDFNPLTWKWKWHREQRIHKGEVVLAYQRYIEDYAHFGAKFCYWGERNV